MYEARQRNNKKSKLYTKMLTLPAYGLGFVIYRLRVTYFVAL